MSPNRTLHQRSIPLLTKKGKRQAAADRMAARAPRKEPRQSNVVPLKICKSGLKCTCDLERDLLEMRAVVNHHICTQCHDYVVFVRGGDFERVSIILDLNAP